jgi:uncharacterized protein (TIGR03089 family)
VTARSIPALLDALLAADPSRPFVTYYDDGTGERTELSVKSFANWVAKTANLTQQGLSAEPGDRIALALPTHWQGLVWLCAAWSCGLVVTFEPAEVSGADLAVVGPEGLGQGWSPGHTVALSLQPMGRGLAAPAAGVVDFATEVLGYPDAFFATDPVTADTPALQGMGAVLTQGQLVEQSTGVAARLELGAVPRLLTDANPCSSDGYATALLAPMVTGGSVVLVRNPDPGRTGKRVAQERVSAVSTGFSVPAG